MGALYNDNTKKPGTSDIIAFSAVSDINRNKVIGL